MPQKNWIQGTLRVLSTIDVQVRRLRRRQINGMLAAGQRQGAFFAINTDYARFPNSSSRLPAALTRDQGARGDQDPTGAPRPGAQQAARQLGLRGLRRGTAQLRRSEARAAARFPVSEGGTVRCPSNL